MIKNAGRKQPKSKKDVMIDAGYAVSTAEKEAKYMMESSGVKKELAKYGLTDELVITSLVEDIQKKPQKRQAELKMALQALGMQGSKHSAGLNVNFNLKADQDKYSG